MKPEMKIGNFVLFKNKRKETPNHPDYSGEINIDGKLRWISMWMKTDKNGNVYYSGSTKEKTPKPQQTTAQPVDFIDDSQIPF